MLSDKILKDKPFIYKINDTRKKKNRKKLHSIHKNELDIQKKDDDLIESGLNNFREQENEKMQSFFYLHNLEVYETKPDGNCLFESIQDQLINRHNIKKNITDLRLIASEYILNNKNDFIPYLFDEKTDSMQDVEEYCNLLVNATSWGSDLEITSLAKYFDCPIIIYLEDSSIKINENGINPALKLAYYKHHYSLGEHYNSLRDMKT